MRALVPSATPHGHRTCVQQPALASRLVADQVPAVLRRQCPCSAEATTQSARLRVAARASTTVERQAPAPEQYTVRP